MLQTLHPMPDHIAVVCNCPCRTPCHACKSAKTQADFRSPSGLLCCIRTLKAGSFEQCKEPARSGVWSLDVLKAHVSLGHYRHVQQVL